MPQSAQKPQVRTHATGFAICSRLRSTYNVYAKYC
jgi:hypothetical protein